MVRQGRKILYVASTFSHLSSFHQPYTDWLAAEGCTVHAAAGGTPRELTGVTRLVELPFEKKMGSPKNLTAVRQLAALLREERYDIISLHTSLAAFFGRLAVMLAGKGDTAVWNTVHGYLFDNNTPPVKRAVLLGAERLTAGVTDRVLTMNRQDLALAEKYRLGKEILSTPGMGMDLTRFSPPTEEERRRAREIFAIPPEAVVLVFAGEFSKRKNQKMLLEAMPLLPKNAWLLLPGKGEEWEACRAIAQNLGVDSRVVFPGFVSRVEDCYHCGDICVSASRIEGLPFHMGEAMSCGLPVVASHIKGHEDLVADGETGFLFPQEDKERFAAAVQELMPPAVRYAMGERARRQVLPYGREAVFPRLTQLYMDRPMAKMPV